MLLDMPRKGLDTKRMVEKLIYMCRPPTKEEQELADKQSQQSQQESPYKDNMLTEVLVELLCESATDVDVAALWEGYKSNPVEDLLQPIMFRGLNCKYSKTIAEELFERVKKSKGPSDICGGYLSLSNDCVDALTLLVNTIYFYLFLFLFCLFEFMLLLFFFPLFFAFFFTFVRLFSLVFAFFSLFFPLFSLFFAFFPAFFR